MGDWRASPSRDCEGLTKYHGRKRTLHPSSRIGRNADSRGVPVWAPWTTSSDPRSEQPHSGQFFAISRVSLVCNVCSRLLPKEWFAERPMASARANSRVPPPRHLCIIMLSPRAPALARSLALSPPVSSSPSLPLLREVCPLLPPCRCRPATSSLYPPRPPVRPHPLLLSLHPCFVLRKRERVKERAKKTKHQVKEKERERERAKEKERGETSRRRVMPKWIRRRVHERETERCIGREEKEGHPAMVKR